MMTRTRRGAGRTTAAVTALAVVATLGVWLIVRGAGTPSAQGSTAAPTPARDFTSTTVPDPITASLPQIDAVNGVSATSAHAPATDSEQRAQQPEGPLLDERLVIPAVGINAITISNPVTAGSLILPEEVNSLTRWDGSADITAKTGTVLVAGHVDNRVQGPGALYWMHTLQPGDVLYLTHQGVVTRWKTTALRSYLKQALPQTVWAGSAGPRQLVVVTCGGQFRNGHYDDNVVLTAIPF